MKTSPTPEALTAYAKGVMGENAACAHLQQRGMEMIGRRVRSPYGEIDLVMLDGDVLVFVEVKARERIASAQAQFAITPGKQRRMMQTVRFYLGEHPEHQRRMMRFDVVTVAKDGILHIPNAFDGAAW